MGRYVLGRLLQLPIILLAIYTAVFVLTSLAPGDPLYGLSDRLPDPQILKQKLAEYGYDRPAWQRYFVWLGQLATGDLGKSFSNRERRIAELIGPNLQHSMLIGGLALLIAVFVGCSAGVLAAAGRNGPLDYASLALVLIGISLPSFVTAAALTFVFSISLNWVPLRWGLVPADIAQRVWELLTLQAWLHADPLIRQDAWHRVRELVLPSFTLSLFYVAYISRLMRSSMIEALNQDYIRTARAKGCRPGRVVISHTVRNAVLPVVSFLGPAAAGLLTGGFVVEEFFGIPGMADHFISGVLNRDLRLLLVVTMIYSTLLVLFNLVVDVAYGFIDPRIRRS